MDSQSNNQSSSHRPWEAGPAPSSQTQTLPSISTLTSKLPPPGDRPHPDLSINPPQRDSGAWMTNNSALTASSTNTMPYLNSAHSPNAPGASPYTPDTTPGSGFGPSLAQTRQQNGALADHPHRGSGDFDESRRSSVAGSIHHGMNNLALAGPTSPSPYHSNNQSQTSIVSGLQQQRGIPTSNGYNNGRYSTMNPISPYADPRRNSRGPLAGRVAPPILENPKAEVYSADLPTRGQAYAFPDPDSKVPEHGSRPTSTFSRRGSLAGSYASSVVTMESSRYPPGQQELPDSHHHGLVNKQLDSVRHDPDSPGQTPYSRTPELRVTHKLAERKRRSEMKDCFEMLRVKLPASQQNKSSKWEILSRAIEYIEGLEKSNKNQARELENNQHRLRDLEMKLQQAQDQLGRSQHQSPFQPPANNMQQAQYNSSYQNGVGASPDQGRTLPPLTNGAMQGVQYSDPHQNPLSNQHSNERR